MKISEEDYKTLKAKKQEDLTKEELEQIEEYENDLENNNVNSDNGNNSSSSIGGNGSIIDEIHEQNPSKLEEKIEKKEKSSTYHAKQADIKTKTDDTDSKEDKPRSILKPITGFLLLIGALGSVMYFFKNKASLRDFDDSVTEVTELGTEVPKPNSEPRTEPNQTEALSGMFLKQ